MAGAFTPLVPVSKTPKEISSSTSRVRLISNAASQGVNQQPDGGSSSPLSATPAGGQGACHTSQPKITLEKEGETITFIRIECTCGQVIEIKCGY